MHRDVGSFNSRIRTQRNLRLFGGSARFVCFLALVVYSPVASTAQQAHDIEFKHVTERSSTLLEVGQPIQRDLRGGEAHTYHVHLLSGQYAHFVANQRGIDIVMSIFGPDGARLAQMDRWSYMWGGESLSIVAPAFGTYRLEVSAANKEDHPGLYDLRLTEVRAPTRRDSLVIAGERAYAEGDELSSASTPEARQHAIVKLEDALRLWRLAGDKLYEATTLLYIGVDYFDSGDSQRALQYYEEAFPIWQSLGDVSGKAAVHEYLAIAYNSLGDYDQALNHDRRALSLAHSTKERKLEAQVLHELGVSYFLLGDNYLATMYFRRAIALSKSQWDHVWEAHSLHHLGEVYLSLNRPRRAVEYLSAALQLSRSVNDIFGEATALNHLGNSSRFLGHYQEALRYHLDSLNLRKTAGYRLGEVQTLINIGMDYESLTNDQNALPYYGQALHLSELLGARRDEASALYGVARIECKQNKLDESLAHIEEAINIIEQLRAKIDDSDLRATYFGSVREYYQFYIEMLMELRRLRGNEAYAAKALEASERLRARVLLETLSRARADIRKGIDPDLLGQERRLQRLIDVESSARVSLLAQDHTDKQIAEVDKRLELLDKQYHGLEAKIADLSPGYTALTRPRPLTVSEIRRMVLDQNTVLLEYILGEKRSYVWVLDREELRSVELPGRKQIERSARRYLNAIRQLKSSRREDEDQASTFARRRVVLKDASEELSRIVLGPVTELLTKRILIVADGTLQYIPFAALPIFAAGTTASSNPAVTSHEIIYLPSASIVTALRNQLALRAVPTRSVAVLADPVFDPADPRVQKAAMHHSTEALISPSRDRATPNPNSLNFRSPSFIRSASEIGLMKGEMRLSRLPFTRYEAVAIARSSPSGETLEALDFEASKKLASSVELSDYRIVHFATHGLLNSEHPVLSGLVFSLVDKHGLPVNGFLELREIYNLELRADLVVLSACETGLGPQVSGEGIIGLTRGFMYAGAARVVASLWKVDDVATAELMRRFYRAMLEEKMSPAEALRVAQLDMLRKKRWSDPYYWAAFTIEGEWK